MTDKSYHEKLDKIQRDLNWVIEYLMRKEQPVTIPPFNPTYPDVPYTRCVKCGMDLSRSMSYICGDQRCPTFARAYGSNGSSYNSSTTVQTKE